MKCDGCGAYVDQMRQTIRLTGRLGEEDVAPKAREKLWRRSGTGARERRSQTYSILRIGARVV